MSCSTHPLSVARRRVGLSQSQLADRADVSRETVSRIERGELPRLRTARAIADALSAGIEAIFPPETSEAPATTPGLRENMAGQGHCASG
jgi:DNA-binding XRE family transcriptional regulator